MAATPHRLIQTPSNHIMAINHGLRAWRHTGGTAIFASQTFHIGSTIRALLAEQVTIMSAVPTLVKALLANPGWPGKEKLALTLVTIGGTVITREDIRLCREGLGALDAVQGFGMSEGAPVVSWLRT